MLPARGPRVCPGPARGVEPFPSKTPSRGEGARQGRWCKKMTICFASNRRCAASLEGLDRFRSLTCNTEQKCKLENKQSPIDVERRGGVRAFGPLHGSTRRGTALHRRPGSSSASFFPAPALRESSSARSGLGPRAAAGCSGTHDRWPTPPTGRPDGLGADRRKRTPFAYHLRDTHPALACARFAGAAPGAQVSARRARAHTRASRALRHAQRTHALPALDSVRRARGSRGRLCRDDRCRGGALPAAQEEDCGRVSIANECRTRQNKTLQPATNPHYHRGKGQAGTGTADLAASPRLVGASPNTILEGASEAAA